MTDDGLHGHNIDESFRQRGLADSEVADRQEEDWVSDSVCVASDYVKSRLFILKLLSSPSRMPYVLQQVTRLLGSTGMRPYNVLQNELRRAALERVHSHRSRKAVLPGKDLEHDEPRVVDIDHLTRTQARCWEQLNPLLLVYERGVIMAGIVDFLCLVPMR